MSYPNLKNIIVGGFDPNDYPNFVDAYIVRAEYAKTGKVVDPFDIDYINENYPMVVNEAAIEKYNEL